VFLAVAVAVRRLAPLWHSRVAVSGGSMAPTLDRGDWLLLDPAAFRGRSPRPGDLVVLRDPRDALDRARVLVKRVRSVDADGTLDVRGDAADASTDSRAFGPVPPGLVLGRPVLRYWPPHRFGRPDTSRRPRPA
jgi:nickel-type superoxide dismutase maturation protease